MDNNNFSCQIISCNNILFNNKIYMITLPTLSGEIAIMKDHEIILSMLKAGVIKILDSKENIIQEFKIQSGFAQINQEKELIILID